MRLSLIVAMDERGGIGSCNRLPWTLPKDLKRVREITMGHSILLGRKNYESIGKPLPGRRNIILTRDQTYRANGCEIIHAMEDLFFLCSGENEVFVFGGSEIYELYLPYVDRMYITKIKDSFEVDTYFPDLDWSEWNEVSKEKHVKDEKNPHDFEFALYERK